MRIQAGQPAAAAQLRCAPRGRALRPARPGRWATPPRPLTRAPTRPPARPPAAQAGPPAGASYLEGGPEAMLLRKVKRNWPDQGGWFEGVITDFNPASNEYWWVAAGVVCWVVGGGGGGVVVGGGGWRRRWCGGGVVRCIQPGE